MYERRRNVIFFVLALVVLELILFFTNYTPHTILAGWDNMMPEFNFRTNLLRGISGAWQQYRGLGLADGMSHAANTLHTIFIWLLSFALPQQILRYAFIFGMHLAGGIGMYALLKSRKGLKPLVALIGALFYMLNFATIQMFYTPFEAFSIHFAALPWLAWSLMGAIQERSGRNLLIFFAIALMTTPQFFVPTLILPAAIILGVIWLISGCKRIGLAALGGFLLINAFWIAPYLVSLPRAAPVIVGAKINQMSSSEDFERNRVFGNAGDVLLLRGFPMDFQDYTNDGIPTYLMQPWRTFLAGGLPTAIGIFFALAALLGFVVVIKSRSPNRAFVVLFAIGFILLGTNIPGIRESFDFIRKTAPTIGEALRFPFTKFSLLFALAYSVLLAEGVQVFVTKTKLLGFLLVALILVQSAPAFTGQFISPNLRVSLSADYQSFFVYMQNQNPDGRILVLPQQTYWSWKLYRSGYRGSGFVWFGIPQAVMDRAFDPWSSQNENAYWELSYALYKKDARMFSSVISKYDISEIVIDGNLATYGNYRSLFMYESKALLSTAPGVTLEKTFGAISLYSVAGTKPAVHLTSTLPIVFPSYGWTDNDVAYRDVGDYISVSKLQCVNASACLTYPFRSLFTKRSVSEREFNITENDKTITVTSPVEATGASILKSAALMYDSSHSGDLKPQSVKPCGLLSSGNSSAEIMSQNDGVFLRYTGTNQRGCLSFDIPDLEHKSGYLTAVETRHIAGRPLMFSLINMTAKHTELETYLSADPVWTTQYFILPPLASDGLGYTVYISNDSIGNDKTVNDIRSIRIYKIPYEEMVGMRTVQRSSFIVHGNTASPSGQVVVAHPNSAFYRVQLSTMNNKQITLILSQSYDDGWLAVTPSKTFPFLVSAGNHVLVNNWENGWVLRSTMNDKPITIYLLFWPQALEYLGFLLLPLPFLYALKMKQE